VDTAKAHVIDALLASPVAKDAEEKHARTVAARRSALSEERATIELQSAERFEAHYKTQATAFEQCQAAERAFKTAKAELGALIARRAVECQQETMRTAAIEAELRGSADPAIDRFIASMHAEWERSLKAQPDPETSSVRNPNTGKVTFVQGPRRVRPLDRANAVRLAIATAEALKLEPDQGGAGAKLAALRAGLPMIGAELKGAA